MKIIFIDNRKSIVEKVKKLGVKTILGDYSYGMPVVGEHFEQVPRDFKPFLLWLITIGVAAKHDGHRIPVLAEQMIFKKRGCIFLYNYFAFKIQPGTEAIIFVRVSSITIDASMFAALIGIHGIHYTGYSQLIGTLRDLEVRI